MSIKQQVDDAIFLANHQRYTGALTTLLLAVAASSRRMFPKRTTKSIENPKKKMSDGEAFSLFLGARIRKVLSGNYGEPDFGETGIIIHHRGEPLDLAYIFYKYYRCELVHEGKLPEDIEFNSSNNNDNEIFSNRISVSVSNKNNKLVLDYGWINVLVKVVVYAKCNGDLFGIKHYELVPIESIKEEDHSSSIVEAFGISPLRYEILKLAVKCITPSSILTDDDNLLIEKFKELVTKNIIDGGAITGLSSRDITDRKGNLLPKGLNVLKEIAKVYELKSI